MPDEVRELRSPFSMIVPSSNVRPEGDFGIYPVPADTPEGDDVPKGLSAAEFAEYSDLIPDDPTENPVFVPPVIPIRRHPNSLPEPSEIPINMAPLQDS